MVNIDHNQHLPLPLSKGFNAFHTKNQLVPKEKPFYSLPEKPLCNSLNCNRVAIKCLIIKGNGLSESLMMMAINTLLHWFDKNLENSIEIVDSRGIRTITVFDCIHYVYDDVNSLFKGYLTYQQTGRVIWRTSFTLGASSFSNFWLKPILELAIPIEYLEQIKKNRLVYNCLIKETAQIVIKDNRFQNLIENRLNTALGISSLQLEIIDYILSEDRVTFNSLTLLQRNHTVYKQLFEEKNKLIRFFHLTHTHSYNKFNKLFKQTKDESLLPRLETLSNFDLTSLKSNLTAAGFTQKTWRYLNRYGDSIFSYLWKIQSNHENRYNLTIRYLNFLADTNFPPPPSPVLLKALLDMQGYIKNQTLMIDADFGCFNTPVITMALNHYGFYPVITHHHINELLMTAYREQDYDLSLDKNQKKRGWYWLLNKCNILNEERAREVSLLKNSWIPIIGSIRFKQYQLIEIQNHYELFCIAISMRNCLENYVRECMENTKRFIIVKKPENSRPLAVIGLKLAEKWQVFESRGFANDEATEEVAQLCSHIELLFNMERVDNQ